MDRTDVITILLTLALLVIVVIAALIVLGPTTSDCFGMCGCNACPAFTPTP